MAIQTTRRLAADILGVGINRVRIDPAHTKRVSEALTREDVRSLIKEKAISAIPAFGVCRIKARQRQKQRAKGRRRGYGRRAGFASARTRKRSAWISALRAQRAYLGGLFNEGRISPETYKKIYHMSKGGFFTRGCSQMLSYLKDNKLLK